MDTTLREERRRRYEETKREEAAEKTKDAAEKERSEQARMVKLQSKVLQYKKKEEQNRHCFNMLTNAVYRSTPSPLFQVTIAGFVDSVQAIVMVDSKSWKNLLASTRYKAGVLEKPSRNGNYVLYGAELMEDDTLHDFSVYLPAHLRDSSWAQPGSTVVLRQVDAYNRFCVLGRATSMILSSSTAMENALRFLDVDENTGLSMLQSTIEHQALSGRQFWNEQDIIMFGGQPLIIERLYENGRRRRTSTLISYSDTEKYDVTLEVVENLPAFDMITMTRLGVIAHGIGIDKALLVMLSEIASRPVFYDFLIQAQRFPNLALDDLLTKLRINLDSCLWSLTDAFDDDAHTDENAKFRERYEMLDSFELLAREEREMAMLEKENKVGESATSSQFTSFPKAAPTSASSFGGARSYRKPLLAFPGIDMEQHYAMLQSHPKRQARKFMQPVRLGMAYKDDSPSAYKETFISTPKPFGQDDAVARDFVSHKERVLSTVNDPMFTFAVHEKVHESRIAHLNKLIHDLKTKGTRALPKEMYATRLDRLKSLLRMAKQRIGPYAASPNSEVEAKHQQLVMEAYPNFYAGNDEDVRQAWIAEERAAKMDVLEKYMERSSRAFGNRRNKKKLLH